MNSADIYKTIENAPKGWSYISAGKHLSIKSPQGNLYSSCRGAFKDALLNEEYSYDDKMALKIALFSFRGWKEDERLPSLWMMKRRKDRFEYIGPGVEHFKSSAEALRFVLKHRKHFSDDDCLKALNLSAVETDLRRVHRKKIDEKRSQLKTKSERVWVDCDDISMPKGWKMNISKGFKVFLSPNGEIFKGKKSVAQFMLRDENSFVTHTGKSKSIPCSACYKMFRTIWEFRMHHRRMHEGLEKKHPCTDCGKMFFQSGDVKMHNKSVHLKIKDVPCNHCGVLFSTKSNLGHHIKVYHN